MYTFNSVQRSLRIFPFLLLTWSLVSNPVLAYFEETFTLRPLDDQHVLAKFQFTTRTADTTTNNTIIQHLPRAISQLVEAFDVDELHLSFTRGTWMYERWGYGIGEDAAGSGAELWARLRNNGQSVDERWRGLTNALAGLFCASLNFIDEASTVVPQLSFQSEHHQNSALRYGILPRETVCTENLTPWIKQLPCQSKAGIATLLNTYRLYKSNYHTMILHVLRTEQVQQIQQTAISVLSSEYDRGFYIWNMSKSLERKIPIACPLADRSLMMTIAPEALEPMLLPKPTHTWTENGLTFHTFDLLKDRTQTDQNFELTWSSNQATYVSPRSVTVHRRLADTTGDHGQIVLEIKNWLSHDMDVTFFQTTPWYMKLYLHSMRITRITAESGISQPAQDVLLSQLYLPAADRIRPAVLEMRLRLPANTTLRIVTAFDKAFLKYTEYPPDANRGFDVGPAVLTINKVQSDAEQSHINGLRFYTEPSLLHLPTPDFSMPYNVITLTCTVIALFFGSAFNLLTRQFEPIRWRKKTQ